LRRDLFCALAQINDGARASARFIVVMLQGHGHLTVKRPEGRAPFSTLTRIGDCLRRHIFQIVSGNKIPFVFNLP
jgi:hypothetical protein